MATTISSGSLTSTPLEVLGYESTRPSRNIIHTVIGRQDPDVTMNVAGMRSGTLTFLYGSESDANVCAAIHGDNEVITLADTDLTTIAMTYVLSGALKVTLEDQTRAAWTVSVDFQEVLT